MFDGVNLDHLHSSILSADIEALKVAQSKLKLQQFPLDNLEVKLTFVYNLEACFFGVNATLKLIGLYLQIT